MMKTAGYWYPASTIYRWNPSKPKSTLWPDAPEGPFSFIQIMLDRKYSQLGPVL